MAVAVQQPSAVRTAVFTSLSMSMDNTQNLHRSVVDQIPIQCPHPRSNVNVLATHQTLCSWPVGQEANSLLDRPTLM